MNSLLTSLAAFGVLAMSASADAQPASPMARMACHSYDEISKQLGQRYHEAPISIGMQSNGNMLQVFASREQDSWTILSVTPQGMGCILAAGHNWETITKRLSLDPET